MDPYYFLVTMVMMLLDISQSQEDYYKDFYRTSAALTQIPRDIPDDAIIVVLINNLISLIEKDSFLNLTVCQGLYLQTNKIKNIEDGAFNGLVKLRVLYLFNNRLRHLTQGMFQGLVSVKRIRLENNNFTSLDPTVFARLPRPLILGLEENPLDCINETLCWLHYETVDGSIAWFEGRPTCRGEADWFDMYCQERASNSSASSEGVSDEKSESSNKTPWVWVGVSAALLVVSVSIVVVVFTCQRRRLKGEARSSSKSLQGVQNLQGVHNQGFTADQSEGLSAGVSDNVCIQRETMTSPERLLTSYSDNLTSLDGEVTSLTLGSASRTMTSQVSTIASQVPYVAQAVPTQNNKTQKFTKTKNKPGKTPTKKTPKQHVTGSDATANRKSNAESYVPLVHSNHGNSVRHVTLDLDLDSLISLPPQPSNPLDRY